MPKIRLDVLLVERGLTRAQSTSLNMAGQVRVNDQVALKPATAIDTKSLTVDSARASSHAAAKTGWSWRFCNDVRFGMRRCRRIHRRVHRLYASTWRRKIYAIDVGKGIHIGS